jgi:hypothetical protein
MGDLLLFKVFLFRPASKITGRNNNAGAAASWPQGPAGPQKHSGEAGLTQFA